MRRSPRRLVARAVGAALVLLVLAPLGIPEGHRLAAADRGLVVVAQTRYDAVPADRLVHVTIDAVATSYTPDSEQGLAYYSGFKFAIPAAAESVVATSGGVRLSARLGPVEDDFREVNVTFSHFVFYQESYAFRVEFELADLGGSPDRELRVGANIVAFSVYAYGSPGEAGSGVQVVLPAGFRASVQGSEMVTGSGPADELVLSAADLPDPFDFYAYLAADRPGTFGELHVQTVIAGRPAPLWIRSWEDDPDWGTQMRDLLTSGLPVLQEMIGLPYAIAGTLTVEEAAPTRLGDYAGTYTQATASVLVRYDADAKVGLHEAAHIWFNETLFEERWINEAFAEFYAVQSARAIGEEATPFGLTSDLLELRIPLNDWGVPGIEDPDTEYFAYAASYHVAGLIFARTDLEGLRTVWRAVANGEMSYQPAHPATAPDMAVDHRLARWQQLLDLLDERTGRAFDDIWDEWIVNAAQEPLMQDRSRARDRYADLLLDAADWDLPSHLRYAMSSWRFDDAEADMRIATEILAAREQIEAQADDLGLSPPETLQTAFEGDGSLDSAQAEAAAELEVLAGIAAATDRLDDDPSLFETIGLLGADPGATLASARTAFEAAQLDEAAAASEAAVNERSGAAATGQLRVGIAGGGLLILGGSTFVGVRLRRRRHAAALIAAQVPSVPIDPPAPDATA